MIAWLLTGILTGTTSTAALAIWRRRAARAWALVERPSREQDVVPLFDQVDHALGDECICGPETIPVERSDGEVRWVYKHHSLDGREHGGALA